MATKYDASSIVVIKDDRGRVRNSPSMYVPNVYKDGAVHILFEIVDNSIDELTIKDPAGTKLFISFDNKTKETIVTDNGRGIPLEKLYDVLTVLAASGKFKNSDDSAYSASGGIFGHGLTVSLYLCKEFECTVKRDGKYLTYKFEDGLLKDTKKGSSKDHGTSCRFIIDPKIIDTHEVTDKDIRERLKEKSFIFDQLNIKFDVLENGKLVKSYSYGGKNIEDFISSQKPDTPIIHVKESKKVSFLKNIADDNMTTEKVDVDIVFAYKEAVLDGNADDYITSYVNTIKTYAGGTHVDGFRAGIQKYFKDAILPGLKGKDKDLQVLPSDMINGICAFVYVSLANREFRGQEKTQLTNQEVKFAVRDVVFDALCNEKQTNITQMVDFVKRVARGRLASKKVRKKDVSNAFSKDRLDKFHDIVYNLQTTNEELILTEGDSASGNAVEARDPHNQAIYSVRKPKNIFDQDTENVGHLKTVFNDILDICGIEAGKKCDPSKSTMKRILMLTDGDIDGDNIAFSTVCLLAKHCKPLIDAGMVGRILPPAYSFPVGNGSKRQYVRSRREFFDTIMQEFIKNVKIGYHGKDFTKKELYDFLSKNFVYDQKLEKLSDRHCCDPKLMEYIAWHYHGNQQDQKKSYWMRVLKPYKQLRILMEKDLIILDGEVPGYDYINLAFDEYFNRYINRFKRYQSINESIDGFSINGEEGKTLYDVMHTFRKYLPKGINRFKGLGELDSKELRDLCMDVNKRTVIIFKYTDFKKDMDKINIIMSTKKNFAEARGKLMEGLQADDLDIDT